MNSLSIHTGCQGEVTHIVVTWSDHNNIQHRADIEIMVYQHDKPRDLSILVNGTEVASTDRDLIKRRPEVIKLV